MFGIFYLVNSYNYLKNNYFQSITKMICNTSFSIIGGGLLGLLIVSHTYPYLVRKYNKKDKNIKNIEIRNYELLYYDEFEDLDKISYEKNELKNLKFKETIEKTPNGKVVMIYNLDTESFWYYTNSKNITFKMLDTVARKFAIDNNCKSLCVNYREEYRNSEKLFLENKEKDDKTKAKSANKSKDKFRDKPKYKSIDKSKENESTLNKKKSKEYLYIKLKDYNNKDTKKQQECILTQKANRFTYKGKIDDFYYTPPEKTYKKISYKNFKFL